MNNLPLATITYARPPTAIQYWRKRHAKDTRFISPGICYLFLKQRANRGPTQHAQRTNVAYSFLSLINISAASRAPHSHNAAIMSIDASVSFCRRNRRTTSTLDTAAYESRRMAVCKRSDCWPRVLVAAPSRAAVCSPLPPLSGRKRVDRHGPFLARGGPGHCSKAPAQTRFLHGIGLLPSGSFSSGPHCDPRSPRPMGNFPALAGDLWGDTSCPRIRSEIFR